MNIRASSTLKSAVRCPALIAALAFLASFLIADVPCRGEDKTDKATVQSSVSENGTATIIVEARGQMPKPPLFFSANATATVTVLPKQIQQSIQLEIKVLQGSTKTINLGMHGDAQITKVTDPNVLSWAIRKVGDKRFLELQLKEEVTETKPTIELQSNISSLPAKVDLAHLTPGDAIGFDSLVNIRYTDGVEGTVTEAAGFAPLKTKDQASHLHTATGGQITLDLQRSGTSPAPIELTKSNLVGNLASDGRSVHFQYNTTAQVNQADSEITILAGNVAVDQIPSGPGYRLKLATEADKQVYKLIFSEAGTFAIKLDFVAALNVPDANSRSLDFTIAASAVVPIELSGLDSNLEFVREQEAIVPVRDEENWTGFLPANGRTKLQWKSAKKSADGKLFFTTSGKIDAKIGTGLLRQDHQIDYHVLQGELASLSLQLRGPGEILDVSGSNIVAWKVSDEGEARRLDITLSQSITSKGQINVRSQTPLGAFPVRTEGLSLNPLNAIRHSGYLRLSNLGSVRLEPTSLAGLTQLAPDQFPGEALESRQIFAYRFPAADYAFSISADRIQPEVNISELVLYQLADTDRVIRADIELDIREAPIREWQFGIPSDYSIVSVTGASVSDYIASTDPANGIRNLRVIFGEDLSGRQLVALHLEKNEPAGEADWVLPRIEYTGAKSVRGNIGIVGAPGFRVAVGETDLLVETPLSYFPKPTPNLQQTFRIRESAWSATMRIEQLPRSVQADIFHLYSLSQETVYGSALINYFITGAPVSQWSIEVPETLGNVMVDGQDVRTWRREGDMLIVSLHQPVMGAYTLLITYEEKPEGNDGLFQAGQIIPQNVQGERGYIQVVSPMQVEMTTTSVSEDMLKLDPLELPAEFRLLSTAPSLGSWQYTARPFQLDLKVKWFQPGSTVTQVVEFSEANSRVSQDGELVTDVLYYVKTRGQRTFRVQLPAEPVRLWEATVNGQPVTARQADDATLIPLPGGTDPNVPVEVRLRLGKPKVAGQQPTLRLPIVSTPVLKTQWSISGDEKQVLISKGGTVAPPLPVLRPYGFQWVAKRGLIALTLIVSLSILGIWSQNRSRLTRGLGLIALGIALTLSITTTAMAIAATAGPAPLQLSLPILAAGELVELQVQNIPSWRVNFTWEGLAAAVVGLLAIVWSCSRRSDKSRTLICGLGIVLVAIGILLQRDGAPWFFGLTVAAILFLLIIPIASKIGKDIIAWLRKNSETKPTTTPSETNPPASDSGIVTTILAMLLFGLSSIWSTCSAEVPGGYEAADVISQQWQVAHKDSRLTAAGTVTLTGRPGDRFLLLHAPAVLTAFDGEGLRLTKSEVPGQGLFYIISIETQTVPEEQNEADETATETDGSQTDPDDSDNADSKKPAVQGSVQQYEATFEYQMEAIKPAEGVQVMTGSAAVQKVDVVYDEPGWQVSSSNAVRTEMDETVTDATKAKLLLAPGPATLVFKPKARDVTSEKVQFFVEGSNLYLPGPGVIDGRHRLHVRTSQGQLTELNVRVPDGLTVSGVSGPVGSWQFDAESGQLNLQLEPAQSETFDVSIETQRGLEPLPTEATVGPLKVDKADGEVGLLAIAFGPDAQPEKLEPKTLSAVNLSDFDASLLPNEESVLHRVFRYGVDGGELAIQVAPVDSEVRLASKQALSLGDERIVLNVNFSAEISRSGLFQLSFPLPEKLEVESLTGDSLHHWAELTEGEQRQIILHLNGKTIGPQNFSLVLAGPTPESLESWDIPRFVVNESTRQTGELVVRPTTGIRLRTITRQNVSETDPRSMGGNAQGALAFRLLQRDWNLVLGIEKLEPWITGQVLQETTLREGQTRTALLANFNVQNASIRSLQVVLPISDEAEIKTLRANGNTVSDFIRSAPDSNIWEVQFKRRVVGNIQFRIEYERRGDRTHETESLHPAQFPAARQLTYFFSVRAGGRLEIDHEELSSGWQRADWSTVPQVLRDAGNRVAPALTLRAVAPANPLAIHATRHSLADALKLRVAKGTLTTILSPTGDQLTAVDLTVEVIQRSSLVVGLPPKGELFSIFVNGESVHSIRQGGDDNAWQFYILPGIDDRTAQVRFVYSVKGTRLSRLSLSSPELNVPLENIEWNVVAPKGFELTDSDGNLELIGRANQEKYDRTSYLSKISGKRQVQAEQATQLLEQANQLLQAGEQSKASWALNSVANRYALDAASNEDARVQLENLQTQQAIVGLNTRRQRLYLDNNRDDTAIVDNEQLRQAAVDNPILQQDQMNFRPQELSQLLGGNTTEDNAILQQIAGRLVQHQHTTEPAPQAILISLPEEGGVYTFSRSVQVAENEPLQLNLRFDLQRRLPIWQAVILLALLVTMAAGFAFTATRRKNAA